MSNTAFQTQYRQEFINGFEQRKSLLLPSVTTEAVIKGNQAVFLVADSGDASAVTRGVNGRIPSRPDNLDQKTAILQEWNDLVTKTGFNIFASQSDQKLIMQQTTMAVLNRKIDELIINELDTATGSKGSASVAASVDLFQRGRVALTNAEVPWDSQITLLAQPSFIANLERDDAFANAEYVSLKPYAGDDMSWRDVPMMYKWRSAMICEHPRLPGKGTSSEKSFLFHRSAIGHAADVKGMESAVGYDDEQGYSYARCTMNMGSRLLQNEGVIPFIHDTLA